jgi:hypothetical protein
MQAFTKQLELQTRMMRDLKDEFASMNQQINEVDQRRFNMSKEEKWRLRVSNIYDPNAFMRLDKECEAE